MQDVSPPFGAVSTPRGAIAFTATRGRPAVPRALAAQSTDAEVGPEIVVWQGIRCRPAPPRAARSAKATTWSSMKERGPPRTQARRPLSWTATCQLRAHPLRRIHIHAGLSRPGVPVDPYVKQPVPSDPGHPVHQTLGTQGAHTRCGNIILSGPRTYSGTVRRFHSAAEDSRTRDGSRCRSAARLIAALSSSPATACISFGSSASPSTAEPRLSCRRPRWMIGAIGTSPTWSSGWNAKCSPRERPPFRSTAFSPGRSD